MRPVGERILFLFVCVIVIFMFSYSLGTYHFNSRYTLLQSLDLGPCLPEGDNYCVHRVPNSFCLTEKNECFCKLGHVAIQEENGISCKTLLSSLKCKVDGDCVHFLNSACHPGAGYCYCPSGTNLIIQERACYKLVENPSSTFCHQCETVGGVCYQFTLHSSKRINDYGSQWYSANNSIYSQRNHKQEYGCSCPIPMGMIKPQSTERQTEQLDFGDPPPSFFRPQQWEFTNIPNLFCAAKLVDIGYFCNAFDVLCVSRNAVCSISPGSASVFRQCACEKDHVPVYEERLGYHECYHILNATQPTCQLCSEVGEVCYTMDLREPRRIGCTCPTVGPYNSMFENRLDVDLALQQNAQGAKCSKQLAVSCSKSQLNICYYLPQFQDVDQVPDPLLVDKILLSSRTGNYVLGEECVMHLVGSNKWCKTIHIQNLLCGVNVSQHQSFMIYRGSILVLRRHATNKQTNIQKVNWTCSSRSNTPMFATSMIDGGYDSELYKSWQFHRDDQKLSITLFTANDNGHPVSEIAWGAPMKLVVNISKPSGGFNYISIEECAVIPVIGNSRRTSLRIIYRGCPVSGSGFKGIVPNKLIHYPWDLQTNSVESSLFPAFQLNLLPYGKLVILNARQRWKQSTKPSNATNVPPRTHQIDPTDFSSNWYQNFIMNMTYQETSKYYHQIRQKIQFSCGFRICQSPLMCTWVNQCGQPRNNSSIPESHSRMEERSLEFTIIEKSCQITVVAYKPKRWRTLSSQVSQQNCSKSICITRKEIVIMSSATILIVGLLAVGIILWRRLPEKPGSSRHPLNWMVPSPSEKSNIPLVDSVYRNNLFSESSEVISASLGYPKNLESFEFCSTPKARSANLISTKAMKRPPLLCSCEHVDDELCSKLSNKANNWVALHEIEGRKPTATCSFSDDPWIRKCEYAMNFSQLQCPCAQLESKCSPTFHGNTLRTLSKADLSHTEENNWSVSRTLDQCHTKVDLHEYPS